MRIKSLLFTLTITICSFSAFAEEKPSKTGIAIVPVKGSSVFKLVYKGESTGRVKLAIYNSDRKLIMSESFRGVDGFIFPLNFAGLRNGEYTIELIDAAGTKVEKINYSGK